jgi:hypothetical protein
LSIEDTLQKAIEYVNDLLTSKSSIPEYLREDIDFLL